MQIVVHLQHDPSSRTSAIRPPHPGSAVALRVAVQEVICPCVAGHTGDSQSTVSARFGLGKRSRMGCHDYLYDRPPLRDCPRRSCRQNNARAGGRLPINDVPFYRANLFVPCASLCRSRIRRSDSRCAQYWEQYFLLCLLSIV